MPGRRRSSGTFLASKQRHTSYEDHMQSLRIRSISAFTRIELLVTIACVVLVLALLLPFLAKSRARGSWINCLGDLKQVGLSARGWALDNGDHYPMRVSVTNGGTMELVASGLVFPHFRAMSNELSTPIILYCPEDKKRTHATNFDNNLNDAQISYFINVDAIAGNGSSLLCGDRNLTNKAHPGSRFVCLSTTSVIGWNKEMHREKGNVCFADGRVATITNVAGALAVRLLTGVTNRLAVP
jgi:prepilin-type processing-associated H-X9-DG protein